ncbi:O-antigen ligase family protein [Paenibacillus sp. SAF-054]|uniref:O-antigen ligase family protein n=1 Tax=unclassified Paenibacillus TaxID=185978 RepID=UPI003F823B19
MKRWVQRTGEAALVTVVLVSCLKSGFYFTADMYPAWTGYGLLFFLAGAYVLKRRMMAARQGYGSSEALLEISFTTPQWLLLAVPFMMMTVYAAHWLLGTCLSVQGSVNQLLRWGFYGLFAVYAFTVARQPEGKKVLGVAWHMAGGLLCGSAVLAVYGLLPLPYAIAHSANPGISATGARLAGLLEYPNTFGLLMAAFLLERLFALPALLQRTPAASAGRLLRAILPLLPYAAALLLSESRGAWLAAGMATAAGLALERRRMLAPLLAAAAPLAGAALLYRQLAAATLAAAPWPGLLALAGIWAGSMLAGLALCRLARSGAAGLRRVAWALSGLLAAGAAAAVFLTAQERIVRNFSTVSARGAIYRDAWRLYGQAPWFGQGGDTWRLSYRAVQSNPYVGSQVHSGYLDILLNTGIIGILLILLLIGTGGWLLYRTRRQLLPVFGVFVLHSAADIDWSFGLVWLLMLLVVAWGASYEPAAAVRKGAVPSITGADNSWSVSTKGSTSAFRLPSPLLFLWLGIAGAGICLAVRGESGIRLHQAAMHESAPSKAIVLLQSSLRWNPADARTALDLAAKLDPKDAESVLSRSLSYSPGHPDLMFALADNAVKRGDALAAAYWTKAGIRHDKYNAGEQTKSLERLFKLARSKLSAGHVQEARSIVQAGLVLYHDYAQRAADRRRAAVRNDREFGLTVEAKEWGSRLSLLEKSLPASPK